MPKPSEDLKSFTQAIRDQVLGDMLASVEEKGKGKGKRARMPDGIVTIAFTDIEDSSGLVSRLGDRDARVLVRRHDDLLREVAKAHDGVEVERAGDGFMLAFATASAAVRGAIELQRALGRDQELTDSDVRVRVGMETGEVIAEEKGYFGRTVFTASRISELSRGGQIVVSQATQLVAGPEEFDFTDLGEHQLKGLTGNHRLFEVAWRD